MILCFAAFQATQDVWWLAAMPLLGYVVAGIGRFFFEKNRPATFKYPLWSLRGDFRLF